MRSLILLGVMMFAVVGAAIVHFYADRAVRNSTGAASEGRLCMSTSAPDCLGWGETESSFSHVVEPFVLAPEVNPVSAFESFQIMRELNGVTAPSLTRLSNEPGPRPEGSSTSLRMPYAEEEESEVNRRAENRRRIVEWFETTTAPLRSLCQSFDLWHLP